MRVPERAVRRWREQDPNRGLVADALAALGAEIDYLHEPPDEKSWGLVLKLPTDLEDVLGVTREILLWGTMHDSVQARDLEGARKFLSANRIRCVQDLLVMITADQDGARTLRDAAEDAGVAVLVITTGELRNFRPRGARELADAFRESLFVRDLYDLRSPVTRNADFFGRSDQLRQLERAIAQGSHVGVFGLRKIGKTSFINRLRESMRSHEVGLIAQADLQRTNAINPSADYLLWHIGESLYDGNRKVRSVRGLRLFGRFDTFSDVRSDGSVFELFDHDIRAVQSRTKLPFVIMLDEIERMFPLSAESPWSRDFVRFWQLLRGLDQENPGGFRFIISGTNPQCVERHAVLGIDNPIYSYFSDRYLGPLSLEESSELLRSYGRKMGLDWSDAVVKRVHNDTGGHPALLRTFASMVHHLSHPRPSAVAPRLEDARDTSDKFLIEQGPLLAQVVAILEDQYEDEFELLRVLAIGHVQEFREMARVFAEDTAHLIGYGLCGEPSVTTHLSSHLLQTYIQRREMTNSRNSRGPEPDFVGSTVDGQYVVESLISSDGGFANVYRARIAGEEHGGTVALKVLPYGKLSKLESEVEILKQLEHPNIVRFVDSGRLENGHVYLAMEYLSGRTLRSFCEAATRPSEHRLMTWAVALLDALVHIHPKTSEIRKIRAQAGPSDDEVQRALSARYGYVHRDIKPENVIIAGDRPVLIDFNISVRVSTPVATVSGTPGYLPTGLIGGEWNPRVDLYQLGLTLLQLGAGSGLDGDNRGDLATMMEANVGPKTAAFVNALCDSSGAGYQTAYTARRDAQRVLDGIRS